MASPSSPLDDIDETIDAENETTKEDVDVITNDDTLFESTENKETQSDVLKRTQHLPTNENSTQNNEFMQTLLEQEKETHEGICYFFLKYSFEQTDLFFNKIFQKIFKLI